MAEIRAFRASRFTAEAGPLSKLVAPPSETISPEERDRLAAEPNNIVHATVPPSDPDDRSKYVRFARASAQLSAWRRGKLLVSDAIPAMYRLTIGNPEASFAGLIVLARITDLDRSGLPPAAVKLREERLRLLEATRTHLELVPVIGDVPQIADVLSSLPTEALGEAVLSDGRSLALDAINDLDAQATLSAMLAPLVLRPASDLPTVEAALAFRTALGERTNLVAEDFIPVLISSAPLQAPSGLVLWSLGEFA